MIPLIISTAGKLCGPIVAGLKKAATYIIFPMVKKGIISLFNSDSGKKTGKIPSYDDKKASLQDRLEISKLLADIKNQAFEEAEGVENNLNAFFEEYIKKVMELLENSNMIRASSLLMIIRLESATKIRRILKQTIASHLSIDNARCLEILQMESGNSKEEAMQTFIHTSLAKGLKELESEISANFQNVFSNIKEILHIKAQSDRQMIERSLKDLQDFKHLHNFEQKQSKEIKILEDLWENKFAVNFLNDKAL